MAAVSVRSLNTPKCTAQALRSTNQRTSDSVKSPSGPMANQASELSACHSVQATRSRQDPIRPPCNAPPHPDAPSALGANQRGPSLHKLRAIWASIDVDIVWWRRQPLCAIGRACPHDAHCGQSKQNHLFNTKFRGFLQKPFKSIVGFGGCDHKDKAFGPNFFFCQSLHVHRCTSFANGCEDSLCQPPDRQSTSQIGLRTFATRGPRARLPPRKEGKCQPRVQDGNTCA